MRLVVLILCAIQFATFLFILFGTMTTSSNPAGNGMAAGIAAITGGLVFVFTLPAFLLTLYKMALKFSLVWSLVIPGFAVWLFTQELL